MTAPRDAAAAELVRQGVAAAGRGAGGEAIALFQRAVALAPQLAAAQANLGLLLMATGRHGEAEPHLQRAASLMPRDAALRNALGVAREALQRYPDAERAYREALEIDPALAEFHANLGNCLRRQGRLEPAIAAYRQALVLRPDHVEALNNLGSSLRMAGRVDEARAAFERVLELDPTHVETHTNLAPFKTYDADDPHIAQLLAQQHRVPSLPILGQARYWFTVGKMLEDAGRFDDSFTAYAEGNRAKRAITPWDEAAHIDLQRRMKATFTRERLGRDPLPATAEGPTPVFIVGMPRSGTSLLEQVLATLPGVHGAGEIAWLSDTVHDTGGDGLRFPEALGEYSADRLLALGRRYVERLRALAPDATHVVDKLPDNFHFVGLIHLMLPNARIVHAMRDPMDACFSCHSRLFIGQSLAYTYDLGSVGRYWVRYDDLMRHWHGALPAGRILDVSYEAMVSGFEAQARRLVAYLGLPWDDRALAFHENRRIVETASVAQVRRPLYGTSVARWKRYEKHLAELVALVQGDSGA